jgi:hypothetical protein
MDAMLSGGALDAFYSVGGRRRGGAGKSGNSQWVCVNFQGEEAMRRCRFNRGKRRRRGIVWCRGGEPGGAACDHGQMAVVTLGQVAAVATLGRVAAVPFLLEVLDWKQRKKQAKMERRRNGATKIWT